MLRRAFSIGWDALPRLDDWIGSALTGLLAAALWVAAGLAPGALGRPVGLVAHTFAIMAVYRLVGTTWARSLRHAVCFIKCRLGLATAGRSEDLP